MRTAFAIVLGLFPCLLSQSRAAQFIPLGDLTGRSEFSIPHGVSSDGDAVVGEAQYFDGTWQAFIWRDGIGMKLLDPSLLDPRGLDSYAWAISDDGTVASGGVIDRSFPGPAQAFRWSSTEGLTMLGFLNPAENARSGTGGVSADGRIIVGSSRVGVGGSEAFRWSQETGLQGLGDLPGGIYEDEVYDFDSYAQAISRDGLVVVGGAMSDEGPEAYRWTAETGMVGLGDLPGGHFSSHASAVSADGSVIAGTSSSDNGPPEYFYQDFAFRWTIEGGMEALPQLAPNVMSSTVGAMTDAGDVIFGEATRVADSGPEHDPLQAFVWDEIHGTRSLHYVLSNEHRLHEELENWQLRNVLDISSNGLFLVGAGANPSGNLEAFLVRLDHLLPRPSQALPL